MQSLPKGIIRPSTFFGCACLDASQTDLHALTDISMAGNGGAAITVPANTFANGLIIAASIEMWVKSGRSGYAVALAEVLCDQTGGGGNAVYLAGSPQAMSAASMASSGNYIGGNPLVLETKEDGTGGYEDGNGLSLFSVGVWSKAGVANISGCTQDWDPTKATVIDFENMQWISSEDLANPRASVGHRSIYVLGF